MPALALYGSAVLKRPTDDPDAVPSQEYPQPQRVVELNQAEGPMKVWFSPSEPQTRVSGKKRKAAAKGKTSAVLSLVAVTIDYCSRIRADAGCRAHAR